MKEEGDAARKVAPPTPHASQLFRLELAHSGETIIESPDGDNRTKTSNSEDDRNQAIGLLD